MFTPLSVLMFVLPPIVKMMKKRLREISFPILTHPLCSQCFIEGSLLHSLFLRNEGILSSLFLSKTCENFRSGFEVSSCFHWFSLTTVIVAHQRDGVLVPMPLMPGCGMRDVDRRDVVQVSAILFCPAVALLKNLSTFQSLST